MAIIARISFVGENFFTVKLYPRKYSLIDYDVWYFCRHSYRLIFLAGARTLMHLTESRIKLKQGRVLGIDDFQQSLKQTEPTPEAELMIYAVRVTEMSRQITPGGS